MTWFFASKTLHAGVPGPAFNPKFVFLVFVTAFVLKAKLSVGASVSLTSPGPPGAPAGKERLEVRAHLGQQLRLRHFECRALASHRRHIFGEVL